jgi:transposase
MAGLSNKKKRELGERMFIEEGMSGKAIAEELEVSEVTISNWRKGRPEEKDWDERRAEVLSAPHKIKEILLRQLKIVAEGGKATIDADALVKISKVIESQSGKTSTQVVFTVFKEFDNWMAQQDPQMAVQFLEYHKMFIHYKAELES